ncbi:hypothetical protein TNCV_2476841 [Trichonephila clavipes]|nr:hypothetical protein TNCV_2476841 [Trichonephila clavipes]
MFLAGHPSQGCFGLQSHCAPCYFFNQASFYPSDFSFADESLEEFAVVDEDNVCSAPIMAGKDIFEFVHSSKNIMDSDSDDEKETYNPAPVPASSEIRNIMKRRRSYIDVNSPMMK